MSMISPYECQLEITFSALSLASSMPSSESSPLHAKKTFSLPENIENTLSRFLNFKEIVAYVNTTQAAKNIETRVKSYTRLLTGNDSAITSLLRSSKVQGKIRNIPEPFQSIVKAVAPTICSLDLSRLELTSSAIKEIAENFVKLRALNLSSDTSLQSIDDEAFQHISKLTSLQKLNLESNSKIANSVFCRSLVQLVNLEELNLASTKVGGDSLYYLGKTVRNLRVLNVKNSPVYLKGWAELLFAKNLEELDLCKVPVFNNSVLRILSKQAPKLRKLNIQICHGYNVEGWKHLGKLAHLEVLHLTDSKACDRDLVHLEALIYLREIDFDSMNAITSQGIQALQQKIPNVKVYIAPPKAQAVTEEKKAPDIEALALKWKALEELKEKTLRLMKNYVLTKDDFSRNSHRYHKGRGGYDDKSIRCQAIVLSKNKKRDKEKFQKI